MAIFLLSISGHVVFSHAPLLRTLTTLKAESSSPIRLTQMGPLKLLYSTKRHLADDVAFTRIGSLRLRAYPKVTFFKSCLYPVELAQLCYPERNFVRNQLLGSSMSLSPLYAGRINDLHVNTTAVLHQPFDWLRLAHVKITTFRVCAKQLCKRAPASRDPQTSLDFLAFASRLGLIPILSQSSATP